MMERAQPAAAGLIAPGIWRRLACMLYEGILLFGVVMVFGLLYSSLTQQRHALQGSGGLQAFLFCVLGAYFVGFWSRGGQTLAMKTWHIRLVTVEGRVVSATRGLARYLFSWLWFIPALASAYYAKLLSVGAILAVVTIGVASYVLLARLRSDRQYLHDVICGTRLIDLRQRPDESAQSPA